MTKISLDLRGLKYSQPITKIAIALKGAEVGQQVEATCDYTMFEQELRGWCKATGNLLKQVTGSGRETTALVEKKS